MINVGLLGAGEMGRMHAQALAGLADVRVIGVSSRSAAKAAQVAEMVGAQPADEAMALLRDPRVDAVSITLPTHLHHKYGLAALAAGKHVLLEKPMGLTVDECDALIEAAARAGRILMLAHVLRFWPEYTALVDLIHSGALGRPLTAAAARLCTPPTWSPWYSDPTLSGGAVLDLHIHDLDMLNWLFGAPTQIVSTGRQGAGGGWNAVFSQLAYGDDVVCQAEANALMPDSYPFTMSLRVLCERGAVEYALQAAGEQVDSAHGGANSLLVYRNGAPPEALPHAGGDGYVRQMAAFVEAVRSGEPPRQGTPEQGRLAVGAALAARRSIECKAPVEIDAGRFPA